METLRRRPALSFSGSAVPRFSDHTQYRSRTMPFQQAVMFFEDVSNTYGWTEVYWLDQADTGAARAALEVLIVDRADMLSSIHQIVGGRVSDAAVLRDSLLTTNTPIVGAIAATALSATEPWTALNVRLECTAAHRGRLFMHGCLEDFFSQPDRLYDDGNANDGAVQAFMADLLVTYRRITVAGVPTFLPITAALPLRQVAKRVGRPFGLLVGRRPIAAAP